MKKFRKITAILATLALLFGVLGSVPVVSADTTTVLYDFEDGILPSTVATVNQNTAVVENGNSSMATKHLKVSSSVKNDPTTPIDYVRVNLPTQSSTIKDVTFDYYSIAPDRFRNHIGFITEVNGQEYFYLSAHYNSSGLGNGDSATNYSFIGKRYSRATSMTTWYDVWTDNVTITADIIKDIKALIFQSSTYNTYQLLVDNIKITTDAPSTFSVIYDGNGETGGTVPTDSTAYTLGANVTVQSGEPAKSVDGVNYLFKGWSDGEGHTYQGGNQFVINKDTTLTAVWEEIKVYYDVDFNLNGHGSGSAPATQIVPQGGKVTEPTAPTDSAWAFDGWYKEAGCTNKWNFGSDTVSAKTTLYAKWINSKDYNSSNGRIRGTFTIDGNTVTGGTVPSDKAGTYNVYAPDGYTVTIGGESYADGAQVTVSGGETVAFSKSELSGVAILTALGNTFKPDLNDTNKYLRVKAIDSFGSKVLVLSVPYISSRGATFDSRVPDKAKVGGCLLAGDEIHIRYKASKNVSGGQLVTKKSNYDRIGAGNTVQQTALNFTTEWHEATLKVTTPVKVEDSSKSAAFGVFFPAVDSDTVFYLDDIYLKDSSSNTLVSYDFENDYLRSTYDATCRKCSKDDDCIRLAQLRHHFWGWDGDLTVVSNDADPHSEAMPGAFVPPAKSYELVHSWKKLYENGNQSSGSGTHGMKTTDGYTEDDFYSHWQAEVDYSSATYFGDYGMHVNSLNAVLPMTGTGGLSINTWGHHYTHETYEGVMLRVTALEGNTADQISFATKSGSWSPNFGIPGVGQSTVVILPWSALGGTPGTDFNFRFGGGVLNIVISDVYKYKVPQIDMVLRTNINAAGTTNTLYYDLDAPAGATSAYIDLKSSMPSFYNATVSLIDVGSHVVASKRMDSLTKDWKKYEIQIPNGASVKKVKVDIDLNSSTAKEMYYVWLNNIGYKDSSGDHNVITFRTNTTQSRAFPVTGAVNNAAGIEYGNGFGGAGGTWYGSMWYEADSSRDYSDHGFISSGEIATAKWNEKNTEVTATNGSTHYASNVVENFKFFTSDNSTLGQEKYHTLWIDSAPSSGYQYDVTNVKAQLFKGSHSGTSADPTALGDLANVIVAARNGSGKIAIKVSRNDEATAVTATARVSITYVGDATEYVMSEYVFASNEDKDVELVLANSCFVNPDGTLKNIQSINYSVTTDVAAKIDVGVSEIYTARPDLKVKAHALVLANNISIQYKIPKEIFTETFYKTDGMTVDFAINGKTQNLTLANAVDDGTYFIFTENINYAYEMADDITATIKAIYDHEDEMTTSTDLYSVTHYAIDILRDPTYASDSKLKRLVSDIIEYGTAAQKYIGHGLDNLADQVVNASVELDPTEIATLSAPWSEGKHVAEFGTSVDVKRVIWSGAALALENSTNVRFKILATSDLSVVPGLYVSINGKKTPLVFGENIFRDSSLDRPSSEYESKTLLGYVVYVRGFNAKDIKSLTDATYQIGYTGGKARTISTTADYCTAKYIYNKWNSDFKRNAGTLYLSELVKYVWAYGLSAAEYDAAR